MKLTKVELHQANGVGNSAVFSFRDPGRKEPYNIRAITGLDADQIVPRSYSASATNTQKYNDLILGQRDVVILVDLNPSFVAGGGAETYSELRDKLYRLISGYRGGMVELRFYNGTTWVASLKGFITRMEAPQFAKTQQVQLTMSCPDPVLIGHDKVITDVSAINEAAFTLTDNLSTAPHGMLMRYTFSAVLPSIRIIDPGDVWEFRVDPSGGYLVGDELQISSVRNNKYVNLVRGGVTTPIADKIVAGSVWPIMFPGANNFAITISPATIALVEASYYPEYWGV